MLSMETNISSLMRTSTNKSPENNYPFELLALELMCAIIVYIATLASFRHSH